MRMGAHACVTRGGGEGECELREVRMCATQVAGGKSIQVMRKASLKALQQESTSCVQGMVRGPVQ